MSLLKGIFPILALALSGYVAARSACLKLPETLALSRLTFKLITPCLLFVNMVHADIPTNFGVKFLLAFYLPVLCVYLIAVLIARYWLAADATLQSVFATATTYSNTTVVSAFLWCYRCSATTLCCL